MVHQHWLLMALMVSFPVHSYPLMSVTEMYQELDMDSWEKRVSVEWNFVAMGEAQLVMTPALKTMFAVDLRIFQVHCDYYKLEEMGKRASMERPLRCGLEARN